MVVNGIDHSRMDKYIFLCVHPVCKKRHFLFSSSLNRTYLCQSFFSILKVLLVCAFWYKLQIIQISCFCLVNRDSSPLELYKVSEVRIWSKPWLRHHYGVGFGQTITNKKWPRRLSCCKILLIQMFVCFASRNRRNKFNGLIIDYEQKVYFVFNITYKLTNKSLTKHF